MAGTASLRLFRADIATVLRQDWRRMTAGSQASPLPSRLLAWARAHPNGAFGLFLALALIITHPGIFFGTKTLFFRDYGVLGYGFVHHYRESILAGELPLWNPYTDSGAPFLAQWGTMVLYPLSLLMVILPMPWSLGFFCLLHFWIGGMGMRKLAEDLKLSPFTAALAGTLYIFNGATLSGLMWPNYTVVLGWLPWLLWCLRRVWTEGGRANTSAVSTQRTMWDSVHGMHGMHVRGGKVPHM